MLYPVNRNKIHLLSWQLSIYLIVDTYDRKTNDEQFRTRFSSIRKLTKENFHLIVSINGYAMLYRVLDRATLTIPKGSNITLELNGCLHTLSSVRSMRSIISGSH